jgi:hypothetical protein
VKNGWLDKKVYGAAAEKPGCFDSRISMKMEILQKCAREPTKRTTGNTTWTRARIVGDLHGQAPVLWCAKALLRD